MLRYDRLKRNRQKFLALTGVTPKKFKALLPAFARAYQRCYPPGKTLAGKVRKRRAGAGRKGSLNSMEQKLLFALVYQKAYPLQELQGEVFEISQSRANHWIHRLLPVLQQALDDTGVLPERKKRLNSSLMARSDAVKGGKALKNRPCATAARRKPIATRMS